MGNWVQKVEEKWRSEGVKLNSPATICTIEETESAINFKFPEDFKEFYLKINGFRNLDWQEHMFYFWPLERIIEEYNESLDKNFIGFCDFLLASHYIGFKKDKSGIFKMYNFHPVIDIIAQTFEETVSMINSSSDLIY